MHCLWKDIGQIRSVARQMWSAFFKDVDIGAIAVTINTTVTLVRDLEEAFIAQYPERVDYWDKAHFFHVVQCRSGGLKENYKEDPESYELADEIMLPAYEALRSYQAGLRPGYTPLYKDNLGDIDSRIQWAEKSPDDKFNDDMITFTKAFADLHLPSQITEKSTLSEDELLRGARNMKAGAPIPLWLVFACQTFLDAQHVLGKAVDIPFSQLKRLSGSIRDSIASVKDLHRSFPWESWPKQREQLDDLLGIIETFVDNDLVSDHIREVSARMWRRQCSKTLMRFPGARSSRLGSASTVQVAQTISNALWFMVICPETACPRSWHQICEYD